MEKRHASRHFMRINVSGRMEARTGGGGLAQPRVGGGGGWRGQSQVLGNWASEQQDPEDTGAAALSGSGPPSGPGPTWATQREVFARATGKDARSCPCAMSEPQQTGTEVRTRVTWGRKAAEARGQVGRQPPPPHVPQALTDAPEQAALGHQSLSSWGPQGRLPPKRTGVDTAEERRG